MKHIKIRPQAVSNKEPNIRSTQPNIRSELHVALTCTNRSQPSVTPRTAVNMLVGGVCRKSNHPSGHHGTHRSTRLSVTATVLCSDQGFLCRILGFWVPVSNKTGGFSRGNG